MKRKYNLQAGDLTPNRNTLVKMFVVDTENLEAEHTNIPPPDDLITKLVRCFALPK